MTDVFQPLLMLAAEAPKPQAGGTLTLLVPALTLLGTILCGVYAALGVKSKLPAWTTVLCLAACFVCIALTFMDVGTSKTVVAHAFEWIRLSWDGQTIRDGQVVRTPVSLVANFAFYIDGLTLLWMLFVTGLATLIALYASEYMSHDVGTGYCRFFAAFNLFVFSMSCLVMGDNLLLLFLGWEGVGLCSYLLIGYFYKKPSAVAAAKKAFIVNRIGDLGLVLGIFLAFVHFGSIEYAVIFAKAQPYIEALKNGDLAAIPLMVQVIPVLLMVGAFGKSAQLPLYVWLPDAMEGPTPVSALIHAATMVTAGVYLVARTYPLFLCSEFALPIVAWVGGLTALLAATIGMAQFDIKRIMAYSTVSQLGYMFAGLGVLSTVGGVYHVLTHAFFKALLFLCCGAVMHGFGGQLDLRKLSGVGSMPGWRIVGIGMLVGCLNLAGFPLITSGYFSKDMILAEAFTTPGYALLGWLLLLTAGLTAYYTFRVYFRVFVGPKYYEPGDEHHGDDHGHDAHGAGHAHGHDGHGAGHEHGHGHAHGQGDGHAGGDKHDHGFHPHPPGWAINTVLAILAVCSFAAIGLYFMKPAVGGHGGWTGGMVHASSAHYTTPFHFGGDHAGGAEHASPDGDHGKSDGHAGFMSADRLAARAKHDGDLRAGSFLGFDAHKAMYYVSAVVGLAGIGVAFVLHYAGRTTAAKSRADGLVGAFGPLAGWARQKWLVDEFYDAVVRKPLLVLSHVFHFIDKLIVDGLVNLAGVLPRWLGGVVRPSQSGNMHGYAAGMAAGLAVLLAIVLFLTR